MTDLFRDKVDVSMMVNGEPVEARVPAGQHMIDFLRLELGLTGAHASCEHGVCGACTIRVDGDAVRGCLMLAAQADGAEVWTVEGLTDTSAISDTNISASIDNEDYFASAVTPLEVSSTTSGDGASVGAVGFGGPAATESGATAWSGASTTPT